MSVSDSELLSTLPKFISSTVFDGNIQNITAMDRYKDLSVEEIRFAIMNYQKSTEAIKILANDLFSQEFCIEKGDDTGGNVETLTHHHVKKSSRKLSKNRCEDCKFYLPDKRNELKTHYSLGLNKELDVVLIYEVLQRLRNVENKLNTSPKMISVETQTCLENEDDIPADNFSLKEQFLSEFESIRNALKMESNAIASLSKITSCLLQDNLLILEKNNLLDMKIQNLETKYIYSNDKKNQSENYFSLLQAANTLKNNVKAFISELHSMFPVTGIGKCFSSDSGGCNENNQDIFEIPCNSFNNESVNKESWENSKHYARSQHNNSTDGNKNDKEIAEHSLENSGCSSDQCENIINIGKNNNVLENASKLDFFPEMKEVDAIANMLRTNSDCKAFSCEEENWPDKPNCGEQPLNLNKKPEPKHTSEQGMAINSKLKIQTINCLTDFIDSKDATIGDVLSKNINSARRSEMGFRKSPISLGRNCSKNSISNRNSSNFKIDSHKNISTEFDCTSTSSGEFKSAQFPTNKNRGLSVRKHENKLHHGNGSRKAYSHFCIFKDSSSNSASKLESKCRRPHSAKQKQNSENEDMTLHVILREKSDVE